MMFDEIAPHLSGVCAPMHLDLFKNTKVAYIFQERAEKIDEGKRIKKYVREKQKSGVSSEIDGTLEMDSLFEQVKSIKTEEAKEVFFWKERKPNQTFVYAGFTDGSEPIGNVVAVKIKYLSSDMQLLFNKGGVRMLSRESSQGYVDCYPEVIIEKVEILADPVAYVKHLKELSK